MSARIPGFLRRRGAEPGVGALGLTPTRCEATELRIARLHDGRLACYARFQGDDGRIMEQRIPLDDAGRALMAQTLIRALPRDWSDRAAKATALGRLFGEGEP